MATASTPRSSFDDPEISGGSFATWGDESALKAGFQSSKRPSGSLSGPSPFIMAGGTDSLATGLTRAVACEIIGRRSRRHVRTPGALHVRPLRSPPDGARRPRLHRRSGAHRGRGPQPRHLRRRTRRADRRARPRRRTRSYRLAYGGGRPARPPRRVGRRAGAGARRDLGRHPGPRRRPHRTRRVGPPLGNAAGRRDAPGRRPGAEAHDG